MESVSTGTSRHPVACRDPFEWMERLGATATACTVVGLSACCRSAWPALNSHCRLSFLHGVCNKGVRNSVVSVELCLSESPLLQTTFILAGSSYHSARVSVPHPEGRVVLKVDWGSIPGLCLYKPPSRIMLLLYGPCSSHSSPLKSLLRMQDALMSRARRIGRDGSMPSHLREGEPRQPHKADEGQLGALCFVGACWDDLALLP